MKWLRARLSFMLLVAAYAASCYWVLTRSAPVIHSRKITIYFAH